VFICISLLEGDQAAKGVFLSPPFECYLVSGSGYVTDLTARAEQVSLAWRLGALLARKQCKALKNGTYGFNVPGSNE